jgi:hypothetical protein
VILTSSHVDGSVWGVGVVDELLVWMSGMDAVV